MTWEAKKKRIETRRRAELERMTAPSVPPVTPPAPEPPTPPKPTTGKK